MIKAYFISLHLLVYKIIVNFCLFGLQASNKHILIKLTFQVYKTQ